MSVALVSLDFIEIMANKSNCFFLRSLQSLFFRTTLIPWQTNFCFANVSFQKLKIKVFQNMIGNNAVPVIIITARNDPI